MKNIFDINSQENERWLSESLGDINSNPVFVRIMREVGAPFHTHEKSDEMFIVLEGELHIDMREDSVVLKRGESFTVVAGTEHRARVPEFVRLVVIGGRDA